MGYLTATVGGRVFDGEANGTMWIDRDGLDGWWDSPEVINEDESIPGGDGEFETQDVTVGRRRFMFRAWVESSSPEWAELELRPWAAALSKSDDIGFSLSHAGRTLRLRRAQIRGIVRVRPHREDMRRTTVEFSVMAADPKKYGPAREVAIDAISAAIGGLRFPIVEGALDFGTEGLTEFPGVFRLDNTGTAAFFPEKFTVRGPLDGFTITSEQSTVEYDGPVAASDELVLTPYAGGRATLNGADVSHNLIRADWVAVQPGETRGYLFTPINPRPGSKLTIDYPEGAWW